MMLLLSVGVVKQADGAQFAVDCHSEDDAVADKLAALGGPLGDDVGVGVPRKVVLEAGLGTQCLSPGSLACWLRRSRRRQRRSKKPSWARRTDMELTPRPPPPGDDPAS